MGISFRLCKKCGKVMEAEILDIRLSMKVMYLEHTCNNCDRTVEEIFGIEEI